MEHESHRMGEPPAAQRLLDRATIHVLGKLMAAPQDQGTAEFWARMAYMEWLARLPGRAPFNAALASARAKARVPARVSPAAAAFDRLLAAAEAAAPLPLPLAVPAPQRRGGARARRLSL